MNYTYRQNTHTASGHRDGLLPPAINSCAMSGRLVAEALHGLVAELLAPRLSPGRLHQSQGRLEVCTVVGRLVSETLQGFVAERPAPCCPYSHVRAHRRQGHLEISFGHFVAETLHGLVAELL